MASRIRQRGVWYIRTVLLRSFSSPSPVLRFAPRATVCMTNTALLIHDPSSSSSIVLASPPFYETWWSPLPATQRPDSLRHGPKTNTGSAGVHCCVESAAPTSFASNRGRCVNGEENERDERDADITGRSRKRKIDDDADSSPPAKRTLCLNSGVLKTAQNLHYELGDTANLVALPTPSFLTPPLLPQDKAYAAFLRRLLEYAPSRPRLASASAPVPAPPTASFRPDSVSPFVRGWIESTGDESSGQNGLTARPASAAYFGADSSSSRGSSRSRLVESPTYASNLRQNHIHIVGPDNAVALLGTDARLPEQIAQLVALVGRAPDPEYTSGPTVDQVREDVDLYRLGINSGASLL